MDYFGCDPILDLNLSMNTISSLKHMIEEYGSKLIEMEADFYELKLTANLIKKYLSMTVEQQLDHKIEDDELVFLIIDQYGIGNYEEARQDLEEFSVVFN